MKNKIKEAYLKYIDEAYSARSSRPANIMHDAIRDAILTVIDPRDGFDVQTNANAGELAQDYIDEELNKFFEKMTKIIKKQVPTAIKNYVAKQKLIDITNELQGEQNE